MIKTARVKHFANIGDIIASLAGLKKYYEITGRKIIFSQQICVPGAYYPGATHPTKDENGVEVMCNESMLEMVKPLLLAQNYIHDVEVYTGQPINIDLDVIRKKVFVNLPHQAIQQWIMMAYPDLAADLSKAWMEIPEVDISDCAISYTQLLTSYLPLPDLKDFAVVNFTERYRNPHIDYFFLKKYQNKLLFAGTDTEYQLFCDKWELKIPRLIIKNFLQLAYILKQVKFLLSNQSFCWNLMEACKFPRILELADYAPNCQAFIGEDSYGFLHQQGVKYYVELLMSKK